MVMCTVTGTITDIAGSQPDTTIEVQLNQRVVKYMDGSNQHIVYGTPQQVTVTNGEFSVSLRDNTNMPDGVYYVFCINGVLFNRLVPDQPAVDFWSLLEPT